MCDALLQESSLLNCSIQVIRKGQLETVREVTSELRGAIRVSVNEGVGLLDDHVTGLTQKRLAGVRAWWVPGRRDVINGMEVIPDQPGSDEEMAEFDAWYVSGVDKVINRLEVRPYTGTRPCDRCSSAVKRNVFHHPNKEDRS